MGFIERNKYVIIIGVMLTILTMASLIIFMFLRFVISGSCHTDRLKKFRSMVRPSGVMMLSGWNCTPYTG